jgi:two-component system KDP operon response regulator KdpE
MARVDDGHTGQETDAEPAPTAGALALIVDDEAAMQRLLVTLLRSHGLRTAQALSGAEAMARAAELNPEVVLLDLGLPDLDGVEVTRRLRQWFTAPILVVSARGAEHDKVQALDAGANDYVTKPFFGGELLARIRVWMREGAHQAGSRDGILENGDLRIDLERRQVWVSDREVHLTPMEYRLFSTLMRYRGRVLTHQLLLEAAWGPRYALEIHYLRVYVAQLRRKLERDAAVPRYLLTEPGVGYRLRAAE